MASTRKTRGNPSQEKPATPPSDKNAKSPSKGGGKLARFFQRLFGKSGKTASGEKGTAAGTSPKAGSTGPQKLTYTRPGEGYETFIARVPQEHLDITQFFASPKGRRDKNGTVPSRDPGAAAAAPRKTSGPGPKTPPLVGTRENPYVLPKAGESPESFFLRAPEDQRGFAQNYNRKGRNDKSRTAPSRDPGPAAAAPRKAGSPGPRTPPPPLAKADNSPLVLPRRGESPESFFNRAPENQRGFAQIYEPKGNRDNARKPSSTGQRKSAATPGVNKEQLDLLFQRFEALKPPKQDLNTLFQRFDALKEMGPPASRRSPPKN